MYIINQAELCVITGGNPAYSAIGVGVGTYAGVATVINATQTLNDFGHSVGEYVYNSTHPNLLGQMVYTSEDFK